MLKELKRIDLRTKVFLAVIVLLGAGFAIASQSIQQTQQKATNLLEKNEALRDKSCTGKLTPSLTEGPYYKEGSPERSNIADPGVPGEKLAVTGYVFDQGCKPVKGAWLDFWQADGKGVYDNAGYKLRGHQHTDAEGKYRLETVVPAEYPGRTPHIHFKARKTQSSATLISQLFFPGVSQNHTDSIFDEALLLDIKDTSDGNTATFNIVLP